MIGQSKTRLLGVSVLIAMFVVGGLTGAVLQRTALAPDAPVRSPQPGPSLFDQLKLTDAQQKQVCTIMQQGAEELKPHTKIMQEQYKAIHAIVDSTNTTIDSVLTPEQRATKDEFRVQRQKYFQQRQAEEKARQNGNKDKDKNKDAHRGPRPSPTNPLGMMCPGLNDGPHEGGPGSGGSREPWGGDSSHGKVQPAPAIKPNKEI